MPSKVIERYRRQIACLLGTQHRTAHRQRALCEIFLRLKHIIDMSYKHCSSEDDGLEDDGNDQESECVPEHLQPEDEALSQVPDTETRVQGEASRLTLHNVISGPEKGKLPDRDDGMLEPSMEHLSAGCEVEEGSQPEHICHGGAGAEEAPTGSLAEEAPSRSEPVDHGCGPETNSTNLEEVVDDALTWRAILNAKRHVVLYSSRQQRHFDVGDMGERCSCYIRLVLYLLVFTLPEMSNTNWEQFEQRLPYAMLATMVDNVLIKTAGSSIGRSRGASVCL
ncbi:hypothetical protein N657DRAFT_448920 [Parathielavia appendiculata]|uniref:Uncharacterized protein n=1 Tax=Parathielavia appendiculata TaxID=2587402 RepID=A0AAN6Z3W6_9PEZI|nr:hypothetical protein N657DRAFT_448920 [Parathielavia appendiculata]